MRSHLGVCLFLAVLLLAPSAALAAQTPPPITAEMEITTPQGSRLRPIIDALRVQLRSIRDQARAQIARAISPEHFAKIVAIEETLRAEVRSLTGTHAAVAAAPTIDSEAKAIDSELTPAEVQSVLAIRGSTLQWWRAAEEMAFAQSQPLLDDAQRLQLTEHFNHQVEVADEQADAGAFLLETADLLETTSSPSP